MKTTENSGISLFGLVFVLFLTLKLCNVIDWSWWWITAPLWMPLSAGLLIAFFFFIYLEIKNRKKRNE